MRLLYIDDGSVDLFIAAVDHFEESRDVRVVTPVHS